MKLDNYINMCIITYPSLYKDTDYKKSRNRVLDQIYFTNGNGLKWYDGELTDNYNESGRLYESIPPDYFEKKIFSNSGNSSITSERRAGGTFSIYPICEYAKILDMPQDVKLDWLLGGEEAVRLAYSYFSDYSEYSRGIYIARMIDNEDFSGIESYLSLQLSFLSRAEKRIHYIKEKQYV